jgi:hypothetical protein
MSPEMFDFFLTTDGKSGEDCSAGMSLIMPYDHDLLPRGTDTELKFFDFDPKHISTKCFESSCFDIIMSNKSEIEG